MDYEAAKTILPGDRIEYTSQDGNRTATVTGPIHIFRPPRGSVVFVPVAGELVVHARVVRVARKGEP